MRIFKTAISLTVLGSILVGGAQASEGASAATPAIPATSSLSSVATALPDAEGAKPDSTGNSPKGTKDQPEHSDRPGRKTGEFVRKSTDKVGLARIDLPDQRQDIKKDLHAALEAERDQIRARLKENRPASLPSRQDARQNLAELKEKLHEHKEVLEAAQSEAKGKRRKDGDP